MRNLIVLLLLLFGCTTQLWNTEKYTEQLTGFYLAPESSHLIVTGKKHSYNFDITEELSRVLKASRTIEFHPSFGRFKLDTNSNISGRLFLNATKGKLSKSEFETVQSLNFKGDYRKLTYSSNIVGKRYVLEGELPFMSLEGTYLVDIEVPRGVVTTIGKIVATPATVTFDTVVIAPIAILVVLTMATGSL